MRPNPTTELKAAAGGSGSHLSPQARMAIAAIDRENHLRQLLIRRPAPKQSNTPAYWAFEKAMASAERLISGANENCIASVTLTTKLTDPKVALERLSRVVEKRLKPHCEGYVSFFERTKNWLIHLHVLAVLKWPIMRPPFMSGEGRMIARDLQEFSHGRGSLRGRKTKPAKRLQRLLQCGLAGRGLGFIAEVDVVDDVESTIEYFTKYLKGVVEMGRLKEDEGIKLFNAVGAARTGLERPRFLTPREKLSRLKMAAFAASYGAASMAEAHAMIGPKWAYRALQMAKEFKLFEYPMEDDFRQDWGPSWPPEALGIWIKDKNYSPTHRRYSYRWNTVEEEDRNKVRRQLTRCWDLPDWAWPGKDWT